MAHIRPYKEKWRAQVQVVGFPRSSSTFDTKEQAEKWAAEREGFLKRRRETRQICDSALLSKIPAAYLSAIAKTDYTHDEIVANAIPMKIGCGIYFLIKDDSVVYVGQSVDVLARISKHRRELTDFDSFNVMACEPETLDEMEQAYIFALMPKYNSVYGGKKARAKRQEMRGQLTNESNCPLGEGE